MTVSQELGAPPVVLRPGEPHPQTSARRRPPGPRRGRRSDPPQPRSPLMPDTHAPTEADHLRAATCQLNAALRRAPQPTTAPELNAALRRAAGRPDLEPTHDPKDAA